MASASNAGVPRVSVVMTVYNGARYLQASIESILDQTYSDFELLIVDDGSIDSTPTILREAAGRDPRIVVIAQEHRGIARAANRGILAARGALIARQDADDISLPERLALQVAFLDEHSEIAMVGGFAEIINREEQILEDLVFPTDPVEIRASAQCAPLFQHGALVIRRDALLAIGAYRPEFAVAEDIDLAARMTERFLCANLPLVLYCYRRHGANVTTVRRQQIMECMALSRQLWLERHRQGWDRLMTGHGVTTPFPRV